MAIFLFHGVIPAHRHAVRNYTRKHLLADEFIAIVDALAAGGTAVSMDDIVASGRHGSPLPPRAFAITFDDGFANNYTVARPLLAARRLPATFYVTTAFVDANESSWIDKIEYAFELCPSVSLTVREVGIDVAADTVERKRAALDEIRRRVKAAPSVDPYAVAAGVWAQLGISRMIPDPDLDRKMTWAEVRALADDPLFTVGGHGHTHRVLEFLSDADLDEEVRTSLSMLGARLGRAVVHYSYPEGLAHCYSPRVVDVLRRHGVACAPTAEPGVNEPGADLFRLRRIMVA